MTAREYIEDIYLRLLRYGVDTNLNSELILTYINKARQSVQKLLLPVYPERFASVITLPISSGNLNTDLSLTSIQTGGYTDINVHTFQLAPPIIDIYEVSATWTSFIHNGTWSVRAREFSHKEMFATLSHSWNFAGMEELGYVYEMVDAIPFIHIADLSQAISDNTNNDVVVNIYATVAISDLEDVNAAGISDVETVIPSFVEELVIYEALLMCLELLNQKTVYDIVSQEKQIIEKALITNYVVKQQRKEVLLPSKEEKEGV